MKELWRRLAWLLQRDRFERELDEEMRHHLALQAERQGGREDALRQFGNIALIREDSRAMWTFTFWEQFAKDIRYGLRSMANNRLFTAMAVLSLALGIGANTAIYSIIDAVMIRALPVPRPNELAIVNWHAKTNPPVIHNINGSDYDEPGGGTTSPNLSWPAYEILRDNNTAFSTLFAYKGAGRLNLAIRGQAELGEVELVSGNFFGGLGIVPAIGRLLGDDDNRPGASHVAVLSYNYWRDRLAGDRGAIGQIIRINNIPFSIAGVAAPEFFGVKPSAAPAVFIPMVNRPWLSLNFDDEQKSMFIDNHFYWVEIMGRLRPGVTPAGAQAELAARFHQYALASAETEKERTILPALWLEDGASGVDSLRRQFSKPLFVLMTMVALILVIACANIANLLLSRANARRREMAVRLSLGASRLRIIRQLLTESVLLAVPGALLGLGVAALGLRFLIWLMADGREDFFLRAQLDWRVLAFTLAVALVTGIVFGLAPAVEATRVDITPALKETRASAPRSRSRRLNLSQILVVSQIAISLVLVLGAGLFVRTLANLHAVELGFNQENVLTFNLNAGLAGYKDDRLRALYAGLEERLAAVPGVRSETVTSVPMVSGWTDSTGILLPGIPQTTNGPRPNTSYTQVGPTFFETMQIPILLGRALDSHDVDGAPLAAVVNEVFAKKYFPNQNPIGKHFGLNLRAPFDMTIVGVSKNARYNSLKRAIPPVSYISYLQKNQKTPPTQIFFELRTIGDPLSMAGTIRKVVHDAAPNVPVAGIVTQASRIESTIGQERTFADLCTVFALLALVIASVGLYGTMAYAVSRRTNEIGIRMALGAARQRIVWMVLREVLILAAAGLVVGLLGAWASASAIKSFLFGMKPADPVALSVSVIVLAAAAILAGYAPAWRASRIDPMAALRHE
jgi:macrolide transport system ATP-binding/permease protein